MLLAATGSAVATSPAPHFEQRIEVPDLEYAFMRDKIAEKEKVPQRCLPRDTVCIGPFEPDLELAIGRTGFHFWTNDTNATVGHVPNRWATYGPYVLPTLSDDLRLCWEGCRLPDPFYERVHANASLTLYVLGSGSTYSYEVEQGIHTLHSGAIPRKWCEWAQYSTC